MLMMNDDDAQVETAVRCEAEIDGGDGEKDMRCGKGDEVMKKV